MAAVLDVMAREWLCFIMRGVSRVQTYDVLSAVIEGGARVVEVPFTAPGAPEVIRELHGRFPDVVVAAGTVITVEQVKQAVDCGADAVVSPIVFGPVVEATVKAGIVSVAGCMTPSEVHASLRMGADIQKVFPANIGGAGFIASVLEPMPGIRLMPSGSVTPDRMADFRHAGAFAAVIGVASEMGVESMIRDGDRNGIADRTRVWLAARDRSHVSPAGPPPAAH
jgi:2-dehydro-3-deoxyphosphogluconate aldolase/(4S)-4-hydroxy-2-oxoglutarate aldolase